MGLVIIVAAVLDNTTGRYVMKPDIVHYELQLEDPIVVAMTEDVQGNDSTGVTRVVDA